MEEVHIVVKRTNVPDSPCDIEILKVCDDHDKASDFVENQIRILDQDSPSRFIIFSREVE